MSITLRHLYRYRSRAFQEALKSTRMHSSRMRTAHSLTVSPYLVVSHARPPGSNHAPWATTCTPLGATTHLPLEQPCMPPRATMHAPQSNHACPPEQPRTPPRTTMHASPGATTHAPPWSNHTCLPGATTHATPPLDRMTDMCKNITFANYVCGR